jgi:hypothetical protein
MRLSGMRFGCGRYYLPAGEWRWTAVADGGLDEVVQGGAVDELVHAVGHNLSDAFRPGAVISAGTVRRHLVPATLNSS